MESVDYPKWQPLSLHEVCMQHIRLVLGLCQGNRTQAARILGVGRTTLYRYLQEKQNVNGTSSAPREVGPSTGPLSASRQSATDASKSSQCSKAVANNHWQIISSKSTRSK